MALAALCGDDEWGSTWAKVLQHRFQGEGEMRGHVVGNLLIVGLWELLGDHVDALDWVGRLLGAKGRVLPMALTPMHIAAEVRGPEGGSDGNSEATVPTTIVRGQVEVATAEGAIVAIDLEPPDPPVSAEALAKIAEADWAFLGPGSWFTSVLPHLRVPALRDAILATDARLVVVLNLEEQVGETGGFGPADHLRVLLQHAPGLEVHTVLADPSSFDAERLVELREVVDTARAVLVLADVAADDTTPRHDPDKLAIAYAGIMARGDAEVPRQQVGTAGESC